MEEEEERRNLKKKKKMEEEEENSSTPPASPGFHYLSTTTASTQRQMPALTYTKKEKQSKAASAPEIVSSTETVSDPGGSGGDSMVSATTVITPVESDNSTADNTSGVTSSDAASIEPSENQFEIVDPGSMVSRNSIQKNLQIVLPVAAAAAPAEHDKSRKSSGSGPLNGNNTLLPQADEHDAGQIYRKSYDYASMLLSPTAMYRQSMQQLREITQQRERLLLQQEKSYNNNRYKQAGSSSSMSLSALFWYLAVAGMGLLVICALLGIIALLIYLVLRPKLPKISIINAQILQFNAAGGVGTGGNNAVLNLNMNFVLQCVNPNRRLGIDYLQILLLVSFRNTSFPVTKLEPFFQAKRSNQLEVANLQATNLGMASLDDGSAIQTAIALNNIPLHAEMDVKAAVQAGSWQTPSFNINFACDFMVSPPSSSLPSAAGQLLGVVCARTKHKIPVSLSTPV